MSHWKLHMSHSCSSSSVETETETRLTLGFSKLSGWISRETCWCLAIDKSTSNIRHRM